MGQQPLGLGPGVGEGDVNWNKVKTLKEWQHGEVQLFPYQLAFGISFRYMSCLKSIMFRLYIGPIKLWFNINLKLKQEETE